MKKIIAIFFLVIFATSAIHANEVLKLPKLFSHFVKHKSETPAMSFSTFIMLHYIEGHGMDADHSQDMQLPFKTMHYTTAGVVLNFPEPFIGNVKPPTYLLQKKFKAECLPLPVSNFTKNIWQPPRA